MSSRPLLPSLPIKLRPHPPDPQAFPHFPLIRSIVPPNVTPSGPEALPSIQAAVVPFGYGKSRFLPEHRAEIEGKGKELGQRSSSSTRKGTSDNLSLRSPLRVPIQYLSRHPQNIPGLIRVKGERELVYLSQSSKANLSTSTTKRAESPIPLHSVLSLYQGARKLSASPTRKTPSPVKKRERKEDGIKTYEGEQHNSVKQGKGTAIYFNGDVYMGAWAGNQRNGKGVLTSKVLGTTFTGEWREDRRSGSGALTCENGDVVEGVWREDALGMADVVIRFLTSEVLYTGSLLDCQLHGFGRADFLRDQVNYVGNWQCGQRHGWGHLSFPNSHYFEGLFEHGYTQGPGLLVYRKALALREEGKGGTLRRTGRRKGLQSSQSHACLPNKTEGLGNCDSFSTFLSEIELHDTDVLWKTMTKEELKAAGCDFEATNGSFTSGKLSG